ncbi:MAG: hypothetical protein ACOC1K_00015 [Nanoarchaeota archaeon]
MEQEKINKKDIEIKNYCNFEIEVNENFLFGCIKELNGVKSFDLQRKDKNEDTIEDGDTPYKDNYFEKFLKKKSETYIDSALDPNFVNEYATLINFNNYIKIHSINGKYTLVINNLCDKRNITKPKYMGYLIIRCEDDKLKIRLIKNKIIFSIETLNFLNFYNIIQEYINKNGIKEEFAENKNIVYLDYRSKGYIKKLYLYALLLLNIMTISYIIINFN